MTGEPPPDVVDALYGGEPAAFVEARDAAVRELRAAGRREEAAAVKALGRPTVAAAGVNRAVRGGAADALWAAGNALAATQAALLAGDGDAAALRAAKATHEEALEEVVAVAGEGARDTLRAASLDAGLRDAVASGRLVKEIAPGAGSGGFGGGFEAVASPAPAKGAKAPKASDAKASKKGARRGGSPEASDGKSPKRKGASAGTSAKAARAEEKARRAAEQEREDAEAARAADAAARARAKETAKQRRALGKKLETARARATRSAVATEAARDALAKAEASSAADADALAALEAELRALGDA